MKKLSLIVCALDALMVAAACGPSDPNTNGTGGSTSSSTTTTGTGGNGNSSNGGGGTGAGGTVNECHPWAEDPFATSDPTCEVCTCNGTSTTDEAFCKQWRDQGIELCPPGGNTCEPGINMCGYNLPAGQAYEMPDSLCKQFVKGDTWTDENFNAYTVGWNPPNYNENGQLVVVGIASPSASFYDGFIMSGKKLFWNRYNEQSTDSIVCTFNADCMTLTCVDSPTGTAHIYWWQNHP